MLFRSSYGTKTGKYNRLSTMSCDVAAHHNCQPQRFSHPYTNP